MFQKSEKNLFWTDDKKIKQTEVGFGKIIMHNTLQQMVEKYFKYFRRAWEFELIMRTGSSRSQNPEGSVEINDPVLSNIDYVNKSTILKKCFS